MKTGIIIISTFLFFTYIVYPLYRFPEDKVFSGESLYNPYDSIEIRKSYKANFHGHTGSWFGLFNGGNNSSEEYVNRYKLLKYDIAGISDYMSINEFEKERSGIFIPVYEFTLGFSKNHYLVVGSKNVNFFGIIYSHTNHQRQFLINNLKEEDNLIAIVHPNMKGAIDKEDIKYLTNYDCLEVLRYDREVSDYWDEILSSGKYVTIMANDDIHNIESPGELARCFNVIYPSGETKDDILYAIKTGKNYGFDWQDAKLDSFGVKLKKLDDIQKLQNVKLKGNLFTVSVDRNAKEIRFIGQNGSVLESEDSVSSADYEIKSGDTYVRTVITFYDNNKIYLNPVIRYNSIIPYNRQINPVNIPFTILNKLLYAGIFGAVVFLPVFLMRKRKK